MKLKNLTYLILAGALTMTACKKEEPTPEPEDTPTPSAAQLSAFFDNNQADAVQSFTIDASSPSPITGAQGTVVSFWANSFVDAQGNPVTGNVDIQMTEIYTKKDMIFQNAQTLGNNNGTLQPLVSGGEFKITASQNGNPLSLAPGWSYNVQVQAPGGTNPNMQNFYSSSTTDTLVWNPQDSSQWGDQGTWYDMYFDSLGWINCDYFMNDPAPQTTVEVDVPQGFDNSNCAVFISFDGLNSMTLVYGYNGTNFSTAPYYTLPEGLAVHFVAISMINNVPHAAIQGATLTTNHIEVISALNATSDTQLATDISNLP